MLTKVLTSKWVKLTTCVLLLCMAYQSTKPPYVQRMYFDSSNAVRYETIPNQNSFNDKIQEDPQLVSYLKQYVIHQPSNKLYNLTRPGIQHFSQYGQSKMVDNLLGRMKGGFFVEVGANTGEWLSNTLFLERERSWTGLLIEPEPFVFRELLSKNRKAYCVNACLSTIARPMTVKYEPKGKLSTLGKINNDAENAIPMQCYPLFSLLLALDVSHIDYFSLDIEGAELPVLQTFPWEKIQVRVFDIETGAARTKIIRDYMESVGYTFMTYHGGDSFFIKQSLFPEKNMTKILELMKFD